MALILKDHTDHKALEGTVVYSVLYMESFLGCIQIEICDSCGFMLIQCEHSENTWDKEGKCLTCNLCGADGT